MSRVSAFLVVGFLSLVPLMAWAAGLVPCGGADEPACQTCHVMDLVNNVIGWLVMILGTIAAIIIVYAGFKLVMSGGNRHAMEDAKELIRNMLIGYVIVLAGWLLIDTGMKMLLTDGETPLGMWNQLQCSTQPAVRTGVTYTPETYEPNTLPLLPGAGVNTGNRQYLPCSPLPNGETNCIPQQDQCRRSGGSPTIDVSSANRAVICMYYSAGGTSGSGSGSATGARPPDLSAGGACNPSVIGRHFPSVLVGSAQCVIRAESSCGARMVSVTDVMRIDGRAFSFGPMQINLTVHELRGCSGYPAVLDCKSAFSGRNYSARVINEALYQQCAAAAQNIDCNIRNGYRIYQEAGNRWSPWSTASACGLR
jgi:Type IV secretion system pilin